VESDISNWAKGDFFIWRLHRPSAYQMLWNLLPDAECREASTPGKGEG